MNRIKLTYQLLITVFISLVISIGVFFLGFICRYQVIVFFYEDSIMNEVSIVETELVDKLNNYVEYDANQNSWTLDREPANDVVHEIINEYPYFFVSLDDEEENTRIQQIGNNSTEQMTNPSFFGFAINEPTFTKASKLVYEDKETPYLLEVSSFEWIYYVNIYCILLGIICFILFVSIVVLNLSRKIKYLQKLEVDILQLSSGDLDHSITIIGKDELGSLGMELDDMRLKLQQKFESELIDENNSVDLITVLSHDLKTPLTALIGYLELIKYHKYKTENERRKYIHYSIEKLQQIKQLKEHMFEYYYVFSDDNKLDTEVISIKSIHSYIRQNIEMLEMNNFTVIYHYVTSDYTLEMNMVMMRRIIDNVFSNIIKHASVENPVIVDDKIESNYLEIRVINLINHDEELHESNYIGLKSIKKMVELHGGKFIVKQDDKNFSCIISLPIMRGDV